MRAESLVTVHGRTYLDAEVEVEVDTLVSGKGKVDARVVVVLGGFAMNAARSLGPLFPARAVHVVTVTSSLDVPRLTAALPTGVVLDPLLTAGHASLPVSVILNPARQCRIVRDPSDADEETWRLEHVAPAALGSHLHIVGRVPLPYVAALQEYARAVGARTAWVGGEGLPPALEKGFDVLCVNAREAERLVGYAATTCELAETLASRATVDDALRVVTGAGRSSTAVATRDGCVEAVPPPVEGAIRTLKGVGDAFAAHFLAAACFDGEIPRKRLEGERSLAVAQAAAGKFLVT
jgi:sugar/nucleoside kinase (ribokinase family)